MSPPTNANAPDIPPPAASAAGSARLFLRVLWVVLRLVLVYVLITEGRYFVYQGF